MTGHLAHRAAHLAAYLAASPVFWVGLSAGLLIAAAILAALTLIDAARERAERRAATVYRGKRRAPRPAWFRDTPTARRLLQQERRDLAATEAQAGAAWARLRATTQEDERATLAGDTHPLPPARPASPHGSPRPVPPWVGRAERPGVMARLGGWHR